MICPTQYGKSFVVALAVLYSATMLGQQWVIVAPSEKKAKIIMTHINEHIFDNVMFYSQLDAESSKERLKKETSKKRITFSGGGEISILSLDQRNSKRNLEAAMGHGGANVILDESSLVEDELYSTVKRMLGGHSMSEEGTFLLEIGNPFYRNHFFRAWENDDEVNKIFIDWERAVEEGRFSLEFIEEMRKEPLFDIFYACLFPSDDEIDREGYRQLILDSALTTPLLSEEPPKYKETKEFNRIFSADVGGGGDLSILKMRIDKKMYTVFASKAADIMGTVGMIAQAIDDYGHIEDPIVIDDTGIGHGVSDRLREKGYNVIAAVVGARSKEKKNADNTRRFANLKAQMSWSMKEWIEAGGAVDSKESMKQMKWFRYKITSDKTIQMEPKDDMKKRTGKSPDYADADMLSFYPVFQPKITVL